MTVKMPSYQRGFGFGEFFIGIFLLVLVSTLALKLIPAYMQDGTIKSIFATIAHDPEMQQAPPSEIKNSFERRASIDKITAITSNDIQISSSNGAPYLSASYSVIIPLVANISLYLEFSPSSAE